MEADPPKKEHRARKSGAKTKKKRKLESKDRFNPKAFTFSSGPVSAQRRAQRTLDLRAKRERANLVQDKTPDTNPPPLVVCVQGPPGVGKSTLIRSLVKHYSRRNLPEVAGPLTMVTGRSRRITLLECKNDMPSMLDAAKIADLVLLLIDGSFGFEMETFEFLNMLQTHGFPKVMGVLTHLDKFRDNRTLRSVKKALKSRFWTEVYAGAKVFFLSGLQGVGYNKREILNLTRFLAVQKTAPLQFRSCRPYFLALRFEDHTTPSEKAVASSHDEESPTSSLRTIHLYGYVKGSTLRKNTPVHIPGAGDFVVKEVGPFRDPCPLVQDHIENRNDAGRKLRTLKLRDRVIYAPQCDIGGVRFESDALYIHVPDHKAGFTRRAAPPGSLATTQRNVADGLTEPENSAASDAESGSEENLPEAVRMVRELQTAKGELSRRVEEQSIRLLESSSAAVATELDTRDADDSNVSDDGATNDDSCSTQTGVSSDDNSTKGPTAYRPQENSSAILSKLIYMRNGFTDEVDAGTGSGLFRESSTGRRMHNMPRQLFEDERKGDDSSNYLGAEAACDAGVQLLGNLPEMLRDVDAIESIAMPLCSHLYRVQGATEPLGTILMEQLTAGTGAAKLRLLQPYLYLIATSESSSGHEATHDSQSLSLPALAAFWTSKVKKQFRAEYFITGGWDGAKPSGTLSDGNDPEASAEQDEAHRQRGPDQDSNGGARTKARSCRTEQHALELVKREQQEFNAAAGAAKAALTEAVELVASQADDSYIIGTFVRVVIDGVPKSWFDHVNRHHCPIVMGGLLPGESNFGMTQARIKRHRWAPRVLKSQDPLLISVGWRRFQTLPLYGIEDRGNVRIRHLKYTPEHLHCLGTFYGPQAAPGTGILAIRNWEPNVKAFRVSATGVVLEAAASFKIMKKLKFVGEPLKVFKNTAFIHRMFNTNLEVAKCQGARIQTASGIRGQIKKAKGQHGTFRATFEDKIQPSDVVILKTWIRVEPKPFCNFLLDMPEWRRIRTIAEIRHSLGLAIPHERADNYPKKIERQPRIFSSLKIPTKLQRELPFGSLKKIIQAKRKTKGITADAVKVDLSQHEKMLARTVATFNALAKARAEKRQKSLESKLAVRAKQEQQVQRLRDSYTKENRKRRLALAGAARERERKRLRVGED